MMWVNDDLPCASDSDVIDVEDPEKTWVQTLEDEHGITFKSRGRKRCIICKDTSGLMRRCNRCRHHVHGAIFGAIPHSIGGFCFLITTEGEFLCKSPRCGKKIPQGQIVADAAGIQRVLTQRGVLRVQDTFPETCLATAQVQYSPTIRQQGTIPTCSAPRCRSLRASPCQHFKCNGPKSKVSGPKI
eukprot:2068911-Amphidinium_carterae.2